MSTLFLGGTADFFESPEALAWKGRRTFINRCHLPAFSQVGHELNSAA
jgi:hypothetical protein